MRLAIVRNPRSTAGANAALWQRVAAEVGRHGVPCDELETRADGTNGDRIVELLNRTKPDVVVAAGGDGTVSEVVETMLTSALDPAPAVAIVPLGTANDIARSFGWLSFRQQGAVAVERAMAALFDGQPHRIDVGRATADGRTRHFVGSFAVGMDADILALRNRLHRRLRLGRGLGGYPLYLLSCAVNAAARRHGGPARVQVDGVERDERVYNLLVTNTPQYAGEFRFDAGNEANDGRLDLHVFRGALEYLRRYPAAWRRHVHYHRGEPVAPPSELVRTRSVVIEFGAAINAQLDGEQWHASDRYDIQVVPDALTLRVPPEGGITRA